MVPTLKHFVGAPMACAMLEREIEVALCSNAHLANTLIVGAPFSGRTLLATAFVRDAGESPVLCDAETVLLPEHLLETIRKPGNSRTLVLRNIDQLNPLGQADLARAMTLGLTASSVLTSLIEMLASCANPADDTLVELTHVLTARLNAEPLRIVATAATTQSLVAPLRRAFSTTIQLPDQTARTLLDILLREIPDVISPLRPAQRMRIARILLALPDSRDALVRALRVHVRGESPSARLHDFTHRLVPTIVPEADATRALGRDDKVRDTPPLR